MRARVRGRARVEKARVAQAEQLARIRAHPPAGARGLGGEDAEPLGARGLHGDPQLAHARAPRQRVGPCQLQAGRAVPAAVRQVAARAGTGMRHRLGTALERLQLATPGRLRLRRRRRLRRRLLLLRLLLRRRLLLLLLLLLLAHRP